MAWTSMGNKFHLIYFTLHSSHILDIGIRYDFGAQDMSDDEIIGLKSTSIKFKNNIKTFVYVCYFLSVTF